MKTSLRHDLPCTPDQFWEVFFDQDLNEKMYREALGCTDVVYESQSGDIENGLERVLRSTQPMDVPSAVKKVMGEATTTVETGTFADGVWSFEMRPTTMADKVQMNGKTRVEATDDGCVRIFDIEGKVKIFGIGKIIEGVIDKQSKEAQDDTANWLRQHFA